MKKRATTTKKNMTSINNNQSLTNSRPQHHKLLSGAAESPTVGGGVVVGNTITGVRRLDNSNKEEEKTPLEPIDETESINMIEMPTRHRQSSWSRVSIKEEESTDFDDDNIRQGTTPTRIVEMVQRYIGAFLITIVVMGAPLAYFFSLIPPSVDFDPRYIDCGIHMDYEFLPNSTIEKICMNPQTSTEAIVYKWILNHPDYSSGRMPTWRKQQLLAVATLHVWETGTVPSFDDNDSDDDKMPTNECEWEKYKPNCTVDGKYQSLIHHRTSTTHHREYNSNNKDKEDTSKDDNNNKVQQQQQQQQQQQWIFPLEVSLLSNLTVLEMSGWGMTQQQEQAQAQQQQQQQQAHPMMMMIPSQLGLLTSLTTIQLNKNHLMGTLPTQLGYLEKLETLLLLNNQLTGWIPNQLWQLPKIQRINLSCNQFRGRIPNDIGQLLGESSSLLQLDLWHNQLTGTLPTSLGMLTTLTDLGLGDNQFIVSESGDDNIDPTTFFEHLSNLNYRPIVTATLPSGIIEWKNNGKRGRLHDTCDFSS